VHCYLVANAIQFDLAMSATEMKQLVKHFIVNNVKIEVERLAEEGVTLSSSLQPITVICSQ
jgi:hypothetical protein